MLNQPAVTRDLFSVSMEYRAYNWPEIIGRLSEKIGTRCFIDCFFNCDKEIYFHEAGLKGILCKPC